VAAAEPRIATIINNPVTAAHLIFRIATANISGNGIIVSAYGGPCWLAADFWSDATKKRIFYRFLGNSAKELACIPLSSEISEPPTPLTRNPTLPVAVPGTGFRPATKAMPKEMLPVVDRPLIQHVVDEARQAGIEHFIFVTGRNKSVIEDHFDRQFEL